MLTAPEQTQQAALAMDKEVQLLKEKQMQPNNGRNTQCMILRPLVTNAKFRFLHVTKIKTQKSLNERKMQ